MNIQGDMLTNQTKIPHLGGAVYQVMDQGGATINGAPSQVFAGGKKREALSWANLRFEVSAYVQRSYPRVGFGGTRGPVAPGCDKGDQHRQA